ncbi:MAG: hypothetical protein E7213_03940 [Clostridium sp.]|nr:hypothetical protein [Clostridium sp.]
MKEILERIMICIIIAMSFIYINSTNAIAVESIVCPSNENKMKIFIGIAVLCIITFLVILKRIMYARKNN